MKLDPNTVDPETRKQLLDIQRDASIKELVEAHNQLNKRVKVLEEARDRQIELNAELLADDERNAKLRVVESKSLLERILEAIKK